MTSPPPDTDDATREQLQERIRALEKQLEEKDDQYFELSATLATIQAETSYQIKKIEKETTLQLNLSEEKLRRTTLEANQAHMELVRLKRLQSQHQNQIQQQETLLHPMLPHVGSNLLPTSTAHDNPPANTHDKYNQDSIATFIKPPPSPTICVFHTGPALARHLLMNSLHEDSIHRLLEFYQHAPQLQETDLVWQILQESLHKGMEYKHQQWLDQALTWSPISRDLLRKACGSSHINRILNTVPQRLSTLQNQTNATMLHLDALASTIMNPLWTPGTIPSKDNTSNPFDPCVCKEWMVKTCLDPQHWYLISTLLKDCTSDDEMTPWLELVTTELVSKWEAFILTKISSRPRRRRGIESIPPVSGQWSPQSNTSTTFMESLHLLSDVFRKPIVDLTATAILLDLLEFEIGSNTCDFNVVLAILGYLQSLAEHDRILLLTRIVNSEEEWAQSALGVTIAVLTTVQLILEDSLDDADIYDHNDSTTNTKSIIQARSEIQIYEMIRNYAIRIIHQVWDNRGSSNVCFSSLVDEQRHAFLGVCSQILVSPLSVHPPIKAMVQLFMDEMQMDREEEVELLKTKWTEQDKCVNVDGT